MDSEESSLYSTGISDLEVVKHLERNYKQIYYSAHRSDVNTRKAPMTDGEYKMDSSKGKKKNNINQSLMIAPENEVAMANTPESSGNELRHKPKGVKNIKYYAGALTINLKKDEETIINDINEHKLLEYYINTMGKCLHNGNLYSYVDFYTEQKCEEFCKNQDIKQEFGNFIRLNWMDALDEKVMLSVRNIDKMIDLELVYKTIEEIFRKIIKITSRTEFNGEICLKLETWITCAENDLINTWGIIVEDQMINVGPISYKQNEVNNHSNSCVIIINILFEIKEDSFTGILKQVDARYWYHVNERKYIAMYIELWFCSIVMKKGKKL